MAILSYPDLGEHPLGGLEEGEGGAAAQEARLGEIFEELRVGLGVGEGHREERQEAQPGHW